MHKQPSLSGKQAEHGLLPHSIHQPAVYPFYLPFLQTTVCKILSYPAITFHDMVITERDRLRMGIHQRHGFRRHFHLIIVKKILSFPAQIHIRLPVLGHTILLIRSRQHHQQQSKHPRPILSSCTVEQKAAFLYVCYKGENFFDFLPIFQKLKVHFS